MRRRRRSHVAHSVVVVRRRVVPAPLELIEDRRLFHPGGALRAPRSFFMRPRLIVAAVKQPALRNRGMRLADTLSHRIGFDIPKQVAICVRRKTRKEVIIAKRVARGGGGAKHRNIWSDVKC